MDAPTLLAATFGGSGYDLACAGAENPIRYRRQGGTAEWKELHNWQPKWAGFSYFVYRNQKQDSRASIAQYRQGKGGGPQGAAAAKATAFTAALVNQKLSPARVQKIMQEHESMIGELLGIAPIQTTHFADFPGAIKSLGAWGGDFLWALSEEKPATVVQYFKERGYCIVLDWAQMCWPSAVEPLST